ncbi:homeobox protein knotted-1-like 2 [Hevea brasiliensis]|nr:homeobox protein knotted-1-like 2 [Hevea brasiliensis]
MESKSTGKEKEEEEAEALKKRISSHPLYELLVQTHKDCLKVGSIDEADQSHNIMKQKLAAGAMPSSSLLTQTDLDHFMEAYCLALTKLKEAMEEPQHETVAFINSMHMQLRELTTTYPETSDHSTTSSDIRRKHD